MRWRATACAGALACGAWWGSGDPVPRLLLGVDLSLRQAHGVRIDASGMVYADGPDGTVAPAGDVLAVLPAAPVPGARWEALVDLVDGRRVPGHLLTDLSTEESVFVRTDRMGEVRIELERIASVRLDTGAPGPSAKPPPADTVHLRNGDSVEGFVVAIGRRVEVETDAGRLSPALTDVSWIELANPREAPSGARVWLGDGSVLEAVRLEMGGGWALLSPRLAGGTTVRVPEEEVLALAPDAGAVRTLASLEMVGFVPDPSRRWSAPPTVEPGAVLGTERVIIPGPMSVTWSLPTGARRLACTLTLPEPARTWGDCEVVVGCGGAELWRGRVWGESPTARCVVDLPGNAEALTVVVLPGALGPVQDVVHLTESAVLIGSP